MLIDVNCYGTKLRHEADNPLPKGENVAIGITDIWIDGTVMWSNMHYSGIAFREAISLANVDVIRAMPAATKQNGAPRDAA